MLPSYLGATVMVGVVVAVVIAVSSLVVGGMAGSALLALAVVLPLVLVQDAWRYVFMVDRPGRALVVDLVWLLSSCTAIVLAPEGVVVSWYVLAWGAGGVLGAVVATALGRLARAPVHPVGYLSDNRELGFRFLGEFATAQAGNYLALLSCGWILGLSAYGAIRGGFLFVGPLQMLTAGVIMSNLPEARRVRDDPEQVVHLVRSGTALVCVATTIWIGVGLALPDSVGEALMGVTWMDARRVLVWLGLTMIGMAVISGALIGVRAFDGTKGLRARLYTIPFQIACPIAGAYIGGLVGFAVGLALGQAVGAVIWWVTFRGLLGHVERSSARHLAPPGGVRIGRIPTDAEALAAAEESV